ncbi:MAG: Rrf2 family transcriptional regulator [Hyphomicrobiaceae bacterium]|nr:Rrf2 family transcriptional regulator [Hyphomicrobiaceae bacterium]
MELNTKGRYAVTAMAELAQSTGQGVALGADQPALALSLIAERQLISLAYLEQLFLKLRRAGLVESARGRAGGYRLARPARDIRISEIMAAVEEDVRMTRCGGDARSCLPGRRCITHGLWDALSDHIESFLETVTLQEVIDGIPGRPAARPLAGAAE